jgi:hypothetical protein
MSEAEYSETKQDTLDQLQELQASLLKMADGNLSLVDSLGAMQLVRGPLPSAPSPAAL